MDSPNQPNDPDRFINLPPQPKRFRWLEPIETAMPIAAICGFGLLAGWILYQLMLIAWGVK